MLMHTQAVTGLPPNHPWAMSDKELIRQLQALSANLPPHMAALVFEAAQRLGDYSEEP
ncbi:hypothetical protein [Aeromonas schubertii]|uniref:hypothetical protein n=1 Tax=Aeromonas schubertii TaxID=652 RepID=UPI001CC59CEF|nr:hypothetical protein [Aeromonas schubertii]MBZ6072032.1 hypothetical protein [Aeromonas schubertii]